ncbi:MAG TPA: mechanosensitive ion channel [Bacteroidales bacterium]|nr:mechanosensitive ion channel [Bacteroidales bacterium]HPI69245.1 mechanosensitive ion channel [Bacteroidales bacterium]HPR73449.1 mechanosensitive ion channel [Bacteroidales bacterium]
MGDRIMTEMKEWFINMGMAESSSVLISSILAFIGLLVFSWLVYFTVSKVIIHFLKKLANRTNTNWDNILFDQKVFRRLSHLIPAVIIHYGASVILKEFPSYVEFIQTITYLYMVVAGLLVIIAVINGFHEIYNTLPVSKDRSVKGIVQVVKIFVYILGLGVVLSIILKKDLTTFFAGMGAMAAVVMLVFKDSILGFVAGVQLSANDMVRLGDWIEMPGRNADGTVIDISLNTVKVRNWDQTISTIPPYALITESFTNWRGMEESGGRRIKRSVSIDMKSIHFLDKDEIKKLKKIQLISDYIKTRELEIEKYNKDHGIDGSMPVNGRRLTNIGTFRKYLEEYLKNHQQIIHNMTFLVRHLQPTDKGLPVEIYVFCKDQRWSFYESIQADIFDHIMAIIPHFGLHVYQNPTGDDISALAETLAIREKKGDDQDNLMKNSAITEK